MTQERTEPEGNGVEVAITGLGWNLPVGSCAAQAYAAVRAGINRFTQWSLTGGAGGGDDGTATVSSLAGTPAADWGQRAEELVVGPLQEALYDAGLYEPDDLKRVHRRSAISAHIAMPYLDRPGITAESAQSFQENARTHCVVALSSEQVEFLPHGHAAGLMAVEQAIGALSGDDADVALVIGVDTLLIPESLAEMLEQKKVKTDFQPSGLIPGEGAAVLVLERLEDAQERGAAIYAVLGSLAKGEEKIPYDGSEPPGAEALSQAVNEVLEKTGQPPESFADVLTDLNGERGRFQEWGLVEVRCLSGLGGGWERHHTADCTGDLGAATGVFLLGLGAGMLRQGHAAGQAVLVTTAAQRGERACASLLAAATVEE